jgi:uncharacterized coiled-coil protein SlyX
MKKKIIALAVAASLVFTPVKARAITPEEIQAILLTGCCIALILSLMQNYFQHRRINELNHRINNQNAQIDGLNDQIAVYRNNEERRQQQIQARRDVRVQLFNPYQIERETDLMAEARDANEFDIHMFERFDINRRRIGAANVHIPIEFIIQGAEHENRIMAEWNRIREYIHRGWNPFDAQERNWYEEFIIVDIPPPLLQQGFQIEPQNIIVNIPPQQRQRRRVMRMEIHEWWTCSKS